METSFETAYELDKTYVMQTYGRKLVEFVRGSGMRLYDSNGAEYLDFMSGIGAVSMGHCHPAVTAALVEQAQKLLHVSNYFYVENRGELAREISYLLERNDADAIGNTGSTWRTFFANSGAEANEGAIKLARRWGNAHKGGATSIVTAKRSFHGRTLAALFATGQENKQEAFLPPVSGFAHVPLNDIDALKEELTNPTEGEVVALMLECIQGEGGVWPCTKEYMQAARELTRELGMLLIIDEVQTGFYRTGKPFAFQHFGIVPDVVSIAKGMGNGAPIAGVCATDEIALAFRPGDHGSTFGGSPLVCAASLATLRAFRDENIEENVNRVGLYLREKLNGLLHVKETRGLGLMLAVEFDIDIAPDLVQAGLSEGLVLNSIGGNIVRFLPPLVCTEEDVTVMVDKLTELIERIG